MSGGAYQDFDLFFEPSPQGVFGEIEIVVRLEIEPESS
jgi:hypothetical protein